MTLYELIERLKVVAEQHGHECRVDILDGTGGWPFAIRVEEERDVASTRKVVCLDITEALEREILVYQRALAARR